MKKLEGQILGLSSQIEDLRSDVSQLVQALKEELIPKKNDLISLNDGNYIT